MKRCTCTWTNKYTWTKYCFAIQSGQVSEGEAISVAVYAKTYISILTKRPLPQLQGVKFFKENPTHLSYFSVWQKRGSSHLAQKHVA